MNENVERSKWLTCLKESVILSFFSVSSSLKQGVRKRRISESLLISESWADSTIKRPKKFGES